MDETLYIQLSAYADGELDAASAHSLEERLAKDPGLQRALADFMALDMAAKKEHVPALPTGFTDALPRIARAETSETVTKIEAAALALPVPAVKDEAYAVLWTTISRRLKNDAAAQEVMALDDGERDTPLEVAPEFQSLRRTWQILDKAAQRLSAPELGAERGAQLWNTIALETVAVPEQHGAWVETLDAAAQAIPVPQPSTEQFAARWKAISAAVATPAAGMNVVAADRVPPVSDEKWNTVWSEIRRQTGAAKNVIPADFTPQKRKSGWRWGVVAAMSMAAATVAMVLTLAPKTDVPGPIAMSVSVPEVSDERYELDLLYLADQPQPVVTLFLKDEAPVMRWMPE